MLVSHVSSWVYQERKHEEVLGFFVFVFFFLEEGESGTPASSNMADILMTDRLFLLLSRVLTRCL